MTEVCERCGAEYKVGDWPFCPHGMYAGIVQDDTWIGGKTIENMGHEPLTFYSKSEWKAELKRRGLREQVRHVSLPGTDKSPHTVRWV